MSRKAILLCAGVLVAGGTIAAFAAPHVRGHRAGWFGGDWGGGGPRLAERLKGMDANKDGKLTQDEFAKAHREHRGHHADHDDD